MKYLETILTFLTQLARIIFPRKRKPAAGDCPCPDPMPAPPEPSLPSDAGNGSNPDLHRGDTLTFTQGDWGDKHHVEPIEIAGLCLMAFGVIGSLYKLLIG